MELCNLTIRIMSPFLEVATLSATPVPTANGEALSAAPANDPALAEKLAAARQHIHTSFAQVVMTLMRLPRYKNCTLADLEHLVLDPLLRNRIAIAHAKPKDGAEAPQTDALAGIAIWAKVSPEVDAKIREQIKAKVFPLRLKSEDWASGDITWLLDVIAPNPKLATAVLANFRRMVGEGELFAHPMIRGLIDRDVLNKAADAPKAAVAAQSADKGFADIADADQTLN